MQVCPIVKTDCLRRIRIAHAWKHHDARNDLGSRKDNDGGNVLRSTATGQKAVHLREPHSAAALWAAQVNVQESGDGGVGRPGPGDQEIKPVLAGHNADACARTAAISAVRVALPGPCLLQRPDRGSGACVENAIPAAVVSGREHHGLVWAVRRSSDKPAFGVRTRAVARIV